MFADFAFPGETKQCSKILLYFGLLYLLLQYPHRGYHVIHLRGMIQKLESFVTKSEDR